MDRSHANWNENTTKTFLDLCIAEKEKLNYNNKGLTKIGWQNLYHNFKSETGRTYDIKQLQNKFNGLKGMFNLWKKLKDKSGGRWDNKTKTITCDADWWENEIAENSNAKQFRGKPLAFEDELTILFGSMTTKDGRMLCLDGIGDRAPSGGCDASRARISEDNVGWSEKNVGVSSVGRVSQRSSKDQEVDSRPTKKTKSIEYYLERVCESMLERIRKEREERIRKEREVTELLQLVKEDGVSEGSKLFFIATELFKSSVDRAIFRRLRDPNVRMGWLQWNWDNAKK